ncbi:MAG: hypothetical protein KC561_03700, partial [Myxococcales bacterium]|nr:hypothetical protein [Myxococcales bacterium]
LDFGRLLKKLGAPVGLDSDFRYAAVYKAEESRPKPALRQPESTNPSPPFDTNPRVRVALADTTEAVMDSGMFAQPPPPRVEPIPVASSMTAPKGVSRPSQRDRMTIEAKAPRPIDLADDRADFGADEVGQRDTTFSESAAAVAPPANAPSPTSVVSSTPNASGAGLRLAAPAPSESLDDSLSDRTPENQFGPRGRSPRRSGSRPRIEAIQTPVREHSNASTTAQRPSASFAPRAPGGLRRSPKHISADAVGVQKALVEMPRQSPPPEPDAWEPRAEEYFPLVPESGSHRSVTVESGDFEEFEATPELIEALAPYDVTHSIAAGESNGAVALLTANPQITGAGRTLLFVRCEHGQTFWLLHLEDGEVQSADVFPPTPEYDLLTLAQRAGRIDERTVDRASKLVREVGLSPEDALSVLKALPPAECEGLRRAHTQIVLDAIRDQSTVVFELFGSI